MQVLSTFYDSSSYKFKIVKDGQLFQCIAHQLSNRFEILAPVGGNLKGWSSDEVSHGVEVDGGKVFRGFVQSDEVAH